MICYRGCPVTRRVSVGWVIIRRGGLSAEMDAAWRNPANMQSASLDDEVAVMSICDADRALFTRATLGILNQAIRLVRPYSSGLRVCFTSSLKFCKVRLLWLD